MSKWSPIVEMNQVILIFSFYPLIFLIFLLRCVFENQRTWSSHYWLWPTNSYDLQWQVCFLCFRIQLFPFAFFFFSHQGVNKVSNKKKKSLPGTNEKNCQITTLLWATSDERNFHGFYFFFHKLKKYSKKYRQIEGKNHQGNQLRKRESLFLFFKRNKWRFFSWKR